MFTGANVFLNRTLILFITVIILVYLTTLYYQDISEKYKQPFQYKSYLSKATTRRTTSFIKKGNSKLILMYTKYFGRREWVFIPDGFGFIQMDGTPCEYRNCIVSYNKEYINQSDALFFHARDLPKSSALRQLRRKYPKQLWIWHYVESPLNAFLNLTSFNRLFNWTATYKRKSEVYVPLFNVLPLGNTSKKPPVGKDFSKGKTKLVMAAITNCNKHRMDMVKGLKQHIQFDLYGHCGRIINPTLTNCPKIFPQCKKRFSQYKFYFAMENSFCSEYVTEKYFMNGLQNGLIPIVLGGADYKQIGPPHSFIDVLDFKDLKSLASYLKYLDNNNTAYNEYHQWRYSYKVLRNNRICELCKVLWERDNQEAPKFSDPSRTTATRISEFWDKKKDCKYWPQILSKYV